MHTLAFEHTQSRPRCASSTFLTPCVQLSLRALPVTARTLETIIRLATASCKVCLRYSITLADVDVAIDILEHVMNKDVGGGEEEEDMQVLEEEDEETENNEEREQAKIR